MIKKTINITVFIVLIIIPVYSYCNESYNVIEKNRYGSINWSTGILQAQGIGIPDEDLNDKRKARSIAIRFAKILAFTNLINLTKKIKIDYFAIKKNDNSEGDLILSKIEKMVKKNAKLVKKDYLSDGTVEVTLQMSFYNAFAQLVLPKEIKQVQEIKPLNTLSISKQSNQKNHTGLIIEAKGINAKPCMSPKVFDENGTEVYGPAYISREFAIQKGVSGYSNKLEFSINSKRVKDNPLIIKALKTRDDNNSYFIISNADALKLKSSWEHLFFMKKCRVIIIID